MAKKEQIAVCNEVTSLNTKSGPKEAYTFELDGKEFTVWEGKYFKAKVGGKYTPVIDIVPRAYTGKDGTLRASMQAVVGWEAI